MKGGFGADDWDVYRLKTAETEQERVRIMREAIEKAVERSRVNYLLITITVAVLLVVLTQSLSFMGIRPVPIPCYPWTVLVMVLLIVLPWQLRRLRVFV